MKKKPKKILKFTSEPVRRRSGPFKTKCGLKVSVHSVVRLHEWVAGGGGDATVVFAVLSHVDVTLITPLLTPAARGQEQKDAQIVNLGCPYAINTIATTLCCNSVARK